MLQALNLYMNNQLFKKLAIPASQLADIYSSGKMVYDGARINNLYKSHHDDYLHGNIGLFAQIDLLVPLITYDYFANFKQNIDFKHGSEYFIRLAKADEDDYLKEHEFFKLDACDLDFHNNDLVAWAEHPKDVRSLIEKNEKDSSEITIQTGAIEEWQCSKDTGKLNFMADYDENLFEYPDEYESIRQSILYEMSQETDSKENEPISPNAAHVGLRYNGDKDRLDLLSPYALKQAARVMTKGAKKYKLRNWENGLSLSETAGSLLRHITSWMAGEDHDEETGELHMAHAMVNAMMIVHLQKYYPQGDDRPHQYLKPRRIALDIDEVLCDWVKYWCEHHQQDIPHHWIFDRDLVDKLSVKKDDKEFWLNIPPLIKGSELPFDPVMYVTKRPIPNEWTQEWLDKNGFPHVPCITLQPHESKLQTLLDHNITEYVDDNFETFRELNANGIVCYLMTAQHNMKYNVGTKRIFNLKDIM